MVRDGLLPLLDAWAGELGVVEVAVEDVPPHLDTSGDTSGDTAGDNSGDGVVADTTLAGSVPLARALRGAPHRIVVYRKPLELRAQGRAELEELVQDVVLEAVAHLLGREPDDLSG
jgi:predicted Zn-dependent protease with MMP-like domain